MLLSYHELHELIESGVIDADPENVNGTSIDVRLGRTILVELEKAELGIVDPSLKQSHDTIAIEMPDNGYLMMPGQCVLASTVETFNLPEDLSCEFKLKSSMARVFLENMLATWCFVGDTEIPLLNGTSSKISELVGKEEWVYSVDSNGLVSPGKATNIFKSGEVIETVIVTLDSGDSFECTPEHLIMLRSGGYIPARELYSGLSLMPLYRRKDTIDGLHEQVYIPSFKNNGRYRWIHTHKLVYEKLFGAVSKGRVIHHINNNPFDNRPDNLVDLDALEHLRLHSNEYNRTTEARNKSSERARERLKVMWADEEFVARKSLESSVRMSEYNKKRWANSENRAAASKFAKDTQASQFLQKYRSENPHEMKLRTVIGMMRASLKKMIDANIDITPENYVLYKRQNAPTIATLDRYFGSFDHALNKSGYLNHTVIGVERRKHDNPVPVYDMTVPGYHNFAIGAGVFVHNCDPFWHNSRLTLELKNELQYNAILIKPNMKIGQMIFYRSKPVPEDRSYKVRGRYNNTTTVTESKGV